MDFGLFVEPQLGGTYDDHLRLARYCEANDIAVFARSDHYLFEGFTPHATDTFPALAGLARETDRVKLCVLVSPISFRHPAVIAKSAATIDEMSGGRMILGVGTGWMDLEHDVFGLELWPVKERFERLEEALGYLRAAFGPGMADFRGKYYSLTGVDVLPKPIDLPIIVGGGGPKKTPTLAGRFADEYNQFVDNPEVLAPKLAVCRAAAEEAGRDPDAILVSVATSILHGRDESEYRERLAAAAATRDMAPAELEKRFAARHVLHGTPDRIQEMVAGFAAAGIGRIYVQYFRPMGDIQEAELDDAFAAIRGG